MSESFAQLFEESLKRKKLTIGSVVKAVIVDIKNGFVVVNAGLKSEGIIPIEEFNDAEGNVTIKVGDQVDVAVDSLEDGFGETLLSRERAKRFEAWNRLIRAHEDNETVIGVIVARVKGGFTVEVDGVRAFLPGSLLDVRPLRETSHLENRPLEFKVVKVDDKRNNIVVSRRALLESANNAERATLLENITEGTVVKGVVKNLTDYGAFVDLGGLDGLLHITDISWKRIKHPSQVLNVGDEIEVKVLTFDRAKNRVSLGMKQLNEDPWHDLIGHYPVGSRLKGKVSTITDYGCFVEIDKGVEGLIHMSEMDWTNKNVNPNKLVALGDEVEVMVLEIDEDRRRISLGLKQCKENPWAKFAQEHSRGEKLTGQIKSITDFGIFIGLSGDIDGLVHLSDLSWTLSNEEAVRQYQKGQMIETVILAIDPEKERISLGVKQLAEDALSKFSKGMVVTGVVTQVEAKQAIVDLGSGVLGSIRASEISHEKVSDATTLLKVGDTIEAKVTNVDRKNNVINVSIKAKETHEQNEVMRELKATVPTTPTLGDLMKDKMDKE
jgi:small subunit ribosomal protein S1